MLAALRRAQAPRKYRNTPTIVDGIRFDSKREAGRYRTLALMQQAGEIRALERQFKIPLVVNGEKVGLYIADFVYEDPLTGVRTYEDSKGVRTPVYRLKAKLVFALYGIKIREV